jgi:hypothetical protein
LAIELRNRLSLARISPGHQRRSDSLVQPIVLATCSPGCQPRVEQRVAPGVADAEAAAMHRVPEAVHARSDDG